MTAKTTNMAESASLQTKKKKNTNNDTEIDRQPKMFRHNKIMVTDTNIQTLRPINNG